MTQLDGLNKRLVADPWCRRRPRVIAISALNAVFSASQKENLCASRLRGGGRSHERTGLRLKFPDSWENTGNFEGIDLSAARCPADKLEFSVTYAEIP